jgi:hypothetical protein
MATELRPDIQAAKDRLRIRLGGGREMKKLPEHLWEGETVDTLCVGTYGRGQGILVLTSTRLLFIQDGLTGGTTEDFPFDKISSIQWTKGMMTGTITIFASGNKAEVKTVNNDDGKAITDRVRAITSGHTEAGSAVRPTTSAPGAAPPPPPPPPPPPSVPAGWYPDADNATLLRYWDGSTWTENTAPKPQ